MTTTNKEFIEALDAQIERLDEERNKLKPLVEQYQLIGEQLDLVKRTRNAFTHNGQDVPIERSNERERVGLLSRVLFDHIREADGRAVHVNELTKRLLEKNINVSRNAISGALGRGIQLGLIARKDEDLYKWMGEEIK